MEGRVPSGFKLPETVDTLVLRSDYSDEQAWTELRRLVEAPYEDGFRAYLTFVEDPALDRLTLDDLIAVAESRGFRSFFFVADHEAIHGPEHPMLAVDLYESRGRTFRVIPAQMWAVENNLSLANMEFSSFANHTDPDGVLRS